MEISSLNKSNKCSNRTFVDEFLFGMLSFDKLLYNFIVLFETKR